MSRSDIYHIDESIKVSPCYGIRVFPYATTSPSPPTAPQLTSRPHDKGGRKQTNPFECGKKQLSDDSGVVVIVGGWVMQEVSLTIFIGVSDMDGTSRIDIWQSYDVQVGQSQPEPGRGNQLEPPRGSSSSSSGCLSPLRTDSVEHNYPGEMLKWG
ncbi:hypothetical protein Tco_0893602 [Tanacetum coccineum]|uniref:Uncharacterized protein n=1 Tax=Tanacetum coccineum TaxID=301880 RepID=A0ABQ5C996_9ASTR